MSELCIDRCLCHGVTFAELKRIAHSDNIRGLEVLRERRLFGTGCGLCEPYVAAMLRTGQVVFDELLGPAGTPSSDPNDNS